jgi:hypothetical protein
MTSDIKLLDGQVKVEALDLCVDAGPERRNGNTTPHRRALVHDYGDGLTINWDNDYKGGVSINSVKKITGYAVPNQPFGGVTVDGGMMITLQAVSLNFKGSVIRLDGPAAGAGGVKVAGPVQFENVVSLQLHKKVSRGTLAPPGWKPTYDLNEAISDLNDAVSKLEARIAAMEKKMAGVV